MCLECLEMAYVYRDDGNPIWRAKIKRSDGSYTTRSTKKTNRKEAEKVALELEEPFNLVRKGLATEKVLLKSYRTAALEAGLGEIKVLSIKEVFDAYLQSKRSIKRADATIGKYKQVIESLLEFLGEERIAQSINTLKTSDIENWRNHRIEEGVAGSTADNQLSIISFALGSCKRKGMIVENAAEGIERTGEGSEKRQSFTHDEVVKLCEEADNEWKGMILLGLWYGMRIGDTSNVKWDKINLTDRTIKHTPTKTGRTIKEEMTYFMPDEVYNYVNAASKKKGASKYLFPSLAGKESGSFGGLSNAFDRLMTKAKIDVPLGVEKGGVGRQFRMKGFHSLRYTQASRMADAGIPEELGMAISMHKSASVHKGYVQFTQTLQKDLFSKLKPVIKLKKKKKKA